MHTSMVLLEGRLDEAERQAEQTYTEGQRAQSWDAGAAHLLALGALRREQGRLAELEDDLIEAGSLYPGYRLFRCVLALACLEAGRPDEAHALAVEIVRGGEETLPHDNGWAYGMTVLAEIVTRTGDKELAQTLYDEMLPFAHLMATGGGEIAGGSVEGSLGQLASLLGRPDDALTHLDRARAVHRAYRSDIWVTHTDVDEAVVRQRRGTDDDRRVAAHLLQAAGEVSRRRGWDALASRGRRARRRPSPRLAARRADAAGGRGRSPGRTEAGRTERSPRSSCCQAHRRVSRAAHPHEAGLHLPRGGRRMGGTERSRRDWLKRVQYRGSVVPPMAGRRRSRIVISVETPRGDAMNRKSSKSITAIAVGAVMLASAIAPAGAEPRGGPRSSA